MQLSAIGLANHPARKQLFFFLLLACLIPFAITGCDSAAREDQQKPTPRPVTYMMLKKTDPSQITRVIGSVESWKVEKVGFQV